MTFFKQAVDNLPDINTSGGQKAIALCAFLTSITVPFGLWMYFSRSGEATSIHGSIESVPVMRQSPEWLHSGSDGDLEFALEQLRLFLRNDSQLIGSPGFWEVQLNAEAARILQAVRDLQSNPEAEQCYGRTQKDCLVSIFGNIQGEYLEATTPQGKAAALFRLEALLYALTTVPSPALPDSQDATFTSAVQQFVLEVRRADGRTLETRERNRLLEQHGIGGQQ